MAPSRLVWRLRTARVTIDRCDTRELDRLLAEHYRGYNLAGHREGRDLILEAYTPGRTVLERFDTEELHVDVIGEVGILWSLPDFAPSTRL